MNFSPVLTVTELNRKIRAWLEHDVGTLCVEGEVSTITQPASRHYYFTLKDANAQIRCVFFRNRHTVDTQTQLQTGQHITAIGSLSLYEARGDYQLIVDAIELAGLGDLHQQFELLKAKLSALGLFAPERKKPFPSFPQTIGIITSSSAAALQDILTTLKRRFPVASVMVYPSEVQGKNAPQQLVLAIEKANHEKRAEVLILARGGGSMEDLWAFNNEALAYAIAESHIPIITGIGHETDFTIADFVADKRAATPTAAAETITPHQVDLLQYFSAQKERLLTALSRLMQHQRLLLSYCTQKLSAKNLQIRTHWQKLDELQQQLTRLLQDELVKKTHLVDQLETLCIHQMKIRLQHKKTQLQTLSATLHALSPLATLGRGYAIATYHDSVLLESETLHIGAKIRVILAKGQLTCEVIHVD